MLIPLHRILVMVCCVLLPPTACESVSSAQSNEESLDDQIWRASDKMILQSLLKRRDADFDRRSVVFDKEWTELVSPMQMIVDRSFADFKFGQNSKPILSKNEKVPEDYKQPYAWRYRMTGRHPEFVLEKLASLKPAKDSRFTSRFVVGAKYHMTKDGLRTFDPSYETSWSEPRKFEGLGAIEWGAEWCLGYGLHKRITSVDSFRKTVDRLFIDGKMRLLDDDVTTFAMELDRSGIVRRAELTISGKPDGSNVYIVETQGTVEPPSAPAVAQSGRYRRIVKPAGNPEYTYQDCKFTFVSMSRRMNDDQFQETLKIR